MSYVNQGKQEDLDLKEYKFVTFNKVGVEDGYGGQQAMGYSFKKKISEERVFF